MHWHAFTYSGRYPEDSEAKNPQAPVRPLSLRDWFRKPASLRAGVYYDAESAYEWLASELRPLILDDDRLGSALRHHQESLRLGQDAYCGRWARDRSGIIVRCLLTCPRTGADPVWIPCGG